MPKYTNESAAGARRAASYNKPEQQPNPFSSEMPLEKGQVDPSVRLGDIKGEINGNVPMNVQMAKPQAYVAKKGSP